MIADLVGGYIHFVWCLVQVPIPPPASLWGHQGPPLTDIERFLSLAAPILGSRNHADLKLVR